MGSARELRRDRGIIMQPENARAIDERRKTQTRRRAKISDAAARMLDAGARLFVDPGGRAVLVPVDGDRLLVDFALEIRCPYGGPGDRLWVREAWCALNTCPLSCPAVTDDTCPDHRLVVFAANGDEQLDGYIAQDDPDEGPPSWRSPLFLRRADARLVLVVDQVRLERVQAITEADAIAEGVAPEFEVDFATFVRGGAPPPSTHVLGYKHGWNRLHGDRAWDRNDPVWAITFHRAEAA